MPKYTKKVTRLMSWQEFNSAIQDLPKQHQAFLTILFLAGVRVSEALALKPEDITCLPDTVYIDFFRLKGSKNTDPIELPKVDCFMWLCDEVWNLKQDPTQRIFPFSRTTAYRIVKRVWPELYPHFFRMNRITQTVQKHDIATVRSYTGISLSSMEHYIAKVDIKRVGQALRDETLSS